jgi:RND family efflux transporter MFP subunit
MKTAFRIIVILMLVLIFLVVLRNNKNAVKFEVANAEMAIDSIPVRVFDLKPDSTNLVLETVGKVKSADEVYVVSQTPGEIKNVIAKIGDKVRKGDIIAQIDDFYALQEYSIAKKAHDQIQKDFDRYKDLAKLDAITQQQLEQLTLQLEGAETKMNSLYKRLNDYLIKAPLDGTINQVFVSRGNATGLGTPVCEIVGGSSVKIEARINPDQAKNLRIGLKASVISDFGHGEKFSAYLAEIGEKAGKFGGVAAIFKIASTEKKIPESGSLVNIQLTIPGEPKLLLPRKALIYSEGKMGLFVLRPDKTAEFYPISYIDFDDTYISLTDMTLNHKQIVVEGNYMLKSGDPVKVVL